MWPITGPVGEQGRPKTERRCGWGQRWYEKVQINKLQENMQDGFVKNWMMKKKNQKIILGHQPFTEKVNILAVKAEGNFMSAEVKFAQEVLVMVKGLCPWANTGKTAAETSVQSRVHSLFICSGVLLLTKKHTSKSWDKSNNK